MPEMTEHNHVKEVKTMGLQGPLWTIAGTAIANVAGQWLNGNGINLGGGVLGGNNTATAAAGLAANKIMEQASEIAKLKSEKYTDEKVQELYNFDYQNNKELTAFLAGLDKRVAALEVAGPLREQIVEGKIAAVAQQANCCCQALTAQLANLQATLAAITKIGVPNSVLCPGIPAVEVVHPTTTTTN